MPARHLRLAPVRLCVRSTVTTGRSRGFLSHRFVHIHGGPVTAGCLSAAFPMHLPERMREVTTPLCWQEWDQCLANHPDRFRQYIVEGIRHRFRIGFDYGSHTCRRFPCNMLSARERPEIINDYLAQECSEGRVLGPLDPAQFPFVQTSKFGVIPKGLTGKWRLIVDMSSPEGASVNDGIQESLGSLTYVGIEEAANSICAVGKGALMAKVDVKSAYRNIPVHPDDRWLMGMLWEGALYVDTALPFGLRSTSKIFTAIADAVEWIARQKGVQFIIHYLDDFLVIGALASLECAQALAVLKSLYELLGLPVALAKLVGPVPCLDFLGFELDSEAMEICLPHPKLAELRELIQSWLGRKSCTKKELHKERTAIHHWETLTRVASDTTRQDLYAANVQATGGHTSAPPPYTAESILSLRPPMVGYIHG